MTPRERQAGYALLKRYPTSGLETVAAFSTYARVSGATVLRFIGRLGFQSYGEFQKALRDEIGKGEESPLSQYDRYRVEVAGDGYMREFVDASKRNIQMCFAGIEDQEFREVAQLLGNPSRELFLIGGRFSQYLASYIGWHLHQLRSCVRIVNDQSGTWPTHLADIDRRSVVMAFDFRRYQSDVIEFVRAASTAGAKVILITDNWISPIMEVASVVWCCPIEVPSPYDSALAGLAVGECLVGAIARQGGDRMRRRIRRIDSFGS